MLLVLTSVPLAIALVAVLCYAAMLRGGAVAIMAVLRSPPLRRPHCRCATDHDATVMILIWNLGTAALITAAGSLFGLRMFRWP